MWEVFVVICSPILGPFEVRKFSVRFSITNRGRRNEEIEVQRPADCVHISPGGGRHTSRGGVSKGRHLAADVLPLAQEVWGSDALGDASLEAARRRERAFEASGGRLEPGQGDAPGGGAKMHGPLPVCNSL